MRVSLLVLLIFLMVVSCNPSKDPVPATATKNKITITSITPAAVYTDEPITIAGTGFDTDMAKDTVDFGRLDLPDPGDPDYVNDTTQVFHPFSNKFKIAKANYIIVSATTTQLIIKSLAPDSLQKAVFKQVVVGGNDLVNKYNFRVRSKGASAVSSKTVTLKTSVPLVYHNFDDTLAPGDSAVFTIRGVYSNSICDVNLYMSCSKIGGCTYVDKYIGSNLSVAPPCTCEDFGTLVSGCPIGVNGISKGKVLKYDEVTHQATVQFLFPNNFFNTSYPYPQQYVNTMIDIQIMGITKDGRSGKPIGVRTYIFPTH